MVFFFFFFAMNVYFCVSYCQATAGIVQTVLCQGCALLSGCCQPTLSWCRSHCGFSYQCGHISCGCEHFGDFPHILPFHGKDFCVCVHVSFCCCCCCFFWCVQLHWPSTQNKSWYHCLAFCSTLLLWFVAILWSTPFGSICLMGCCICQHPQCPSCCLAQILLCSLIQAYVL